MGFRTIHVCDRCGAEHVSRSASHQGPPPEEWISTRFGRAGSSIHVFPPLEGMELCCGDCAKALVRFMKDVPA